MILIRTALISGWHLLVLAGVKDLGDFYLMDRTRVLTVMNAVQITGTK